MIEKERNNIQINSLRIINLYDADYNFILKFYWPHKANHQSKQDKLLSENTWGARPNCNTDNVFLLDELITEIHRLTFRDMCKYQNDASTCYDRIIPQHVMIYSRKFNVPKKVCKLAATILNKTKYHVQASVRKSPNYHSSTK